MRSVLTPRNVLMALGALLIVAGLAFLWKSFSIPQQVEGGTLDAAIRDLKVRTNHIGLAVIFLGVALEIVAMVGAAIWTGRPPDDPN
jgi:hypothetical protein